jgi:cation transporter-like permease
MEFALCDTSTYFVLLLLFFWAISHFHATANKDNVTIPVSLTLSHFLSMLSTLIFKVQLTTFFILSYILMPQGDKIKSY